MQGARWFLGLDGGGTKTHCVLYDKQKDRLFINCGGPTNHEVLKGGMEDLPRAIDEVALPLFGQANISYEKTDGASFGMGGVDMPIQKDMISRLIKDMGFKNFVLSNDSYLGIKAECGSCGISAVNGSGYSVTGISPAGESIQIGGHGSMTGDKGGASYLVPAVTEAAYSQLFKGGRDTIMTKLIEDWLHIKDRADFCQAVALAIFGNTEEANLMISKILYTAAGEGDMEALRILTQCGMDYVRSIRSAAQLLKLPKPVEVILVGSQFTKCTCTRTIDVIRQELQKEGSYDLRVISTSPVAGALFWAMSLTGDAPDKALRDDLKVRLRHPENGGVR